MKKIFFLQCLCMLSIISNCLKTNAQSLFTYGNKAVSKEEFLNAFNKNPVPDSIRKKALQEYVDLYVNYKLKVQAAYDAKLNEQPSLQLESNNFKAQLAETHINQEADVELLIEQAHERSQKDIHVAHVFIEITPETDTIVAKKQIEEAYQKLLGGADFFEVASNYSTDPFAKQSKGDLGFITVFGLQYDMENEVYALAPNTFCKPYRSKLGYHIFKNIGERKAWGKRKIAQIFIALPPNPSITDRQKAKELIDSIYLLIQKGQPFEILAQQFSNDVRSAQNGGLMQPIGVGEVDSRFEDKIFSLSKIGQVSEPFLSEFGYHIIKLVEILPVAASVDSGYVYAELKSKVEKDSRIAVARKMMLNKWLKMTKFKMASNVSFNALWQFTDSSLKNNAIKNLYKLTDSTILFSFAKANVMLKDWISFIQPNASKIANSDNKYASFWKEFTEQSCLNYYKQHLDEYNLSVKKQLQEFDEANLLFAAMDKYVWTKAVEDSVGLRHYYTNNKQHFWWEAGVSGMIINTVSEELAKELIQKITKSPTDWRSACAAYGNLVTADSGRFEFKQISLNINLADKHVGYISAPEKSNNDENFTFFIIKALHPQREIRLFDDARGIVISEYQNLLEQQWLTELKKKYPVKLNKQVLSTIE